MNKLINFNPNKVHLESIWNILANIATRGQIVFTTIILSHYFSSKEYSEYSIIQNTTIALFSLLTMGINTTTLRYIAYYKNNKDACGQIYSLSTLATTLITILSAVVIYANTEKISFFLFNENVTTNIHILCLILITTIILGLQNSLLTGFQIYYRSTKIQLGIAIIIAALQFLLAPYARFHEILYIVALGNLICTIANWLIIKKYLKEKNIITKTGTTHINIRELLHFTFNSCISSIIVYPSHFIVLHILQFSEDKYFQVSLFQTCLLWSSLLSFIPTSFANSLTPVFTQLLAEQTPLDKSSKIIKNNIKIFLYFTVTTLILFSILTPFIINIYGEKFQKNILSFLISGFIAFFISTNSFLGNLLISRGQTRSALITNITWVSTYMLLAELFNEIEVRSATIMLTCCLFAYLMHSAASVYFTQKQLWKKYDS